MPSACQIKADGDTVKKPMGSADDGDFYSVEFVNQYNPEEGVVMKFGGGSGNGAEVSVFCPASATYSKQPAIAASRFSVCFATTKGGIRLSVEEEGWDTVSEICIVVYRSSHATATPQESANSLTASGPA
jgi:hypothetical protein